MKLACGRESSNEKSSSLVTVLERVFSTALDPIGLKYCPVRSRSASCPLWYSAEKKQSLLQTSTSLPLMLRYLLLHVWIAYLPDSSRRNSRVKRVSSPHGMLASTWISSRFSLRCAKRLRPTERKFTCSPSALTPAYTTRHCLSYLRTCSQMDVPELSISRHFGSAGKLVLSRTKEISANHVLECPSTTAVLGYANLELAAGILLITLTGHVTEWIDRQIFIQMRP